MRRVFQIFVCLLLLGPCVASASQAPHRFGLEANLGPLPVDFYTKQNFLDGAPILPNCSQTWTVQACYRAEFLNYAKQHVSGLRFMFGITGGGYSTAIDTSGNIKQAWLDNLSAFLKDVAAAGITQLTPTPQWGGWGGDPYQTISVADACTGTTIAYNFFPGIPYGSVGPSSGPADYGVNNAYNCSPTNPMFVGWPKLYILINAFLSEISAEKLNVEELDLYNGINVTWFPVSARWIYDASYTESYAQSIGVDYAPTDADVLQNVRLILSANGFDPGAATYSIGSPTRPSMALFDCKDVYGGSARITSASALWAAFAGPNSAIGPSPHDWLFKINGLICDYGNFTTPYMISLPVSHTPPSVLDIHDYFQSVNGATDQEQIADETVLVEAFNTFIGSHTEIHKFIIGETYSSDRGSDYGNIPLNIVPDKLQAYIANMTMRIPVAIRPWGNGVLAQYAFPQNFSAFSGIVKPQ